MRLTPKSLLIALAFGLMCYALIDGIRYGSGWGVAMALAVWPPCIFRAPLP
jgi:hypothetical protein